MSEAIQFLKLGKSLVTGLVAAGLSATPTLSYAGGAVTGATEMTQMLNNGELIHLVGQSTEQINNQIKQITQLAEQIQNQLNIYQNMLQNTAQLPNHIWGQVEGDLNQLRDVVNEGQGIAFSMGNADDLLKQRLSNRNPLVKLVWPFSIAPYCSTQNGVSIR